MKKRAKKLSLSRETLRHLERMQLGRVVGGGGDTNEILTGCACTDTCVSDCGTCVGCGGGTGGGTSGGIGGPTGCDTGC